jgi:molybdopterin synthase catalytic subunit
VSVRVIGEPFDPWAELTRHEAALAARGAVGACAVFVGTARDFNAGELVAVMRLEHYPGMTDRQLSAIEREARARWALVDTLVIHRYGELRPGDPIVLCAAWSAHREEAFAACRYLIEELKTRATFWKQEDSGSGRRWVEQSG